jgi:hypothetical protein
MNNDKPGQIWDAFRRLSEVNKVSFMDLFKHILACYALEECQKEMVRKFIGTEYKKPHKIPRWLRDE